MDKIPATPFWLNEPTILFEKKTYNGYMAKSKYEQYGKVKRY